MADVRGEVALLSDRPFFSKGERTVGTTLGVGLHVGTSKHDKEHDLGWAAVQLTYNLTGLLGRSRFYQGNLQLVGELFGGGQFSPDSAYLIGALPSLRYNLDTGTRWTPFIEAGLGICFTDIGPPDLGTTFEFVEQAGVGVRWACRKNLALTLEARIMHVSNGGIKHPNHGVNTVNLQFGVHRLF